MEEFEGSAYSNASKVERRKNELAGDRPALLKVNRASCKIKKTSASSPAVVQRRQPLIIHTFSPKIIQTDPSNFMWMVQKLTGSADTRSRCKKNKPQAIECLQLPATMESATISSNIADMSEIQMLVTETSHHQESSCESDGLPLSKAGPAFSGEINVDDSSPRGPLPAFEWLGSISEEYNLTNFPPPSFNFCYQNTSELAEPFNFPLLEATHLLANEPCLCPLPSPMDLSLSFLNDLPFLSLCSVDSVVPKFKL